MFVGRLRKAEVCVHMSSTLRLHLGSIWTLLQRVWAAGGRCKQGPEFVIQHHATTYFMTYSSPYHQHTGPDSGTKMANTTLSTQFFYSSNLPSSGKSTRPLHISIMKGPMWTARRSMPFAAFTLTHLKLIEIPLHPTNYLPPF